MQSFSRLLKFEVVGAGKLCPSLLDKKIAGVITSVYTYLINKVLGTSAPVSLRT